MCGKGNLKYITVVSVILHKNSQSQLKHWSIQPYPDTSQEAVPLISEFLNGWFTPFYVKNCSFVGIQFTSITDRMTSQLVIFLEIGARKHLMLHR